MDAQHARDALLAALAVLGGEATLPVAAEVAGLDVEAASSAADELAASGIVGAGRPLRIAKSRRIAQAIKRLSAGERARLHRRAATALLAAHAPPAAVVDHLLACDPCGDPDAVVALCAAAEEALSLGRTEQAVSWLERALLEPPAPERLVATLVALGRAELVAGRSDAASDHLRRALLLAEDDECRAAAARELARTLVRANDLAGAMAALERAIDDLWPAARELALGLEVELAALAPTTAWALNRVQERMTQREWNLTGATANERALATLVAELLATERGTAAEAAALGERAVAGGPHDHEPTRSLAPTRAIWVLLRAERFDVAAGHIEHTLLTQRRIGDEVKEALVRAVRAYLHLQTGSLPDAVADAREAAERAGEHRWEFPFRLASAVLVETLVELGELVPAQQALRRVGPVDGGKPNLATTQLILSRGTLRLAQGRIEDGIADLLAVGDLMQAGGMKNPAGYPWVPRVVPALVGTGRDDEASKLAAENLVLAERWGAPATLAAALGAHALTLSADLARPALARALDALDGSPAILVRCRLELQLASLLLAAGELDAAAPLLEAAHTVARAAGAAPICASAARLEAQLAERAGEVPATTGLAHLTARELEVVRLVARGMTNGQIADELVISPRTAQSHVGSALRKTGTSRRTELAALAIHAGIATR